MDDHEQGRAFDPRHRLTIPGRLLLIATLLLFVGGVCAWAWELIEALPGGRYPVLIFWLPVAIGCAGVFSAGAWALEKLGVKIYR